MTIAEEAQDQILNVLQKGVQRSTSRLTALSKTRWDCHIISVDRGPGARFQSILARDAREHFGVYFSSPGERYLVIFSEESGQAVVQASPYARPGVKPVAHGTNQPILMEVANILINGLSGELAERQGMARVISSPRSVWSKKLQIYERAFGDLPAVDTDSMLSVLIHISSPALAADCTLMLRLDMLSTTFLLSPDPDIGAK